MNVCAGDFLPANGYTLKEVVSVNGSDADGGCLQECVGEASGIRRCDCIGKSLEYLLMG